MSRIRMVIAAVLLAGVAAGCGGVREKGANKDYDRPKPTANK